MAPPSTDYQLKYHLATLVTRVTPPLKNSIHGFRLSCQSTRKKVLCEGSRGPSQTFQSSTFHTHCSWATNHGFNGRPCSFDLMRLSYTFFWNAPPEYILKSVILEVNELQGCIVTTSLSLSVEPPTVLFSTWLTRSTGTDLNGPQLDRPWSSRFFGLGSTSPP